jgi:MaoC like domain
MRNTVRAYPRERFSSEVALSPEIVVEFANAAGDNNPIHHDAVFAATTPYCPTSRSTVLRGFLWLLLTVTGWLDRREREALAYLIEENRLLRRQVGGRRLRFTDDERRRLAIRAHAVGRKALRELATIITPDTLLQWHRQLVAPKWTRTRKHTGRRGVLAEIRQLVVRMAEENPTWGSYEGPRCQGPFVSKGNLHTLTIAAEADSS